MATFAVNQAASQQNTAWAVAVAGVLANKPLFIVVGWTGTGADDPAVSVTGETTTALLAAVRASNGDSVCAWQVAAPATGGSKTVNINTTGAVNKVYWVFQYNEDGTLDTVQSGTGTSANASVSHTTTAAGAAIAAMISEAGFGDATPADAVNWTDRLLPNAGWYIDGQYDLDVGAAGAKTVGWSHSNSGWAVVSVAWKPGAAGPSIVSADDTTPSSGQSVTLAVTGAGATQGASTLAWGGVAQACTAWSDTSITFTANPPATLKNGQSANLVLTVSSIDSAGFALTLNPPAGWSYVDITSLAAEGVLETSPPLEVGWQVEIADPAVAYSDGTWSTPVLTRSFQYRVHDGTSFGALGTVTITPSYIPGVARVYDGSSWVRRGAFVYDGSEWVRRRALPQ